MYFYLFEDYPHQKIFDPIFNHKETQNYDAKK